MLNTKFNPPLRYATYHRQPYQMDDEMIAEVKMLSKMHEFFELTMNQSLKDGNTTVSQVYVQMAYHSFYLLSFPPALNLSE